MLFSGLKLSKCLEKKNPNFYHAAEVRVFLDFFFLLKGNPKPEVNSRCGKTAEATVVYLFLKNF